MAILVPCCRVLFFCPFPSPRYSWRWTISFQRLNAVLLPVCSAFCLQKPLLPQCRACTVLYSTRQDRAHDIDH
ncbi:hypothetical protein M431DRAFT_508984 [Trichoderma harzianum CBS 226.95]|uniref:Uncharacterized protein n=1 Tax=Trichoderma harzianum CBS 226.95 TaxID=983964 RepID=A0A2T4AAJ2_TRIHA|nr:hypothetical protein M431DRAFT_508984 [Trichoderma harzianum CBS 226.95]PTB53938.1 hypothetical protein M431DRAFT_508984 [Trichoderma harzianum CBS 226.95]